MTALAPTLQAFFTDRLTRQKNASPHTIAAYRDTLRLLLGFAWQRTGSPPSRLGIEDLDAPLVAAFLDHLEHERGNSARSRNARLAAIHSLFSFAALQHPEHAEVIARVLAIPPKRFTRTVVSYLTDAETEALLAAPDTRRWIGRRDHALLAVAIQTGLRVSELTALTRADVHLGPGPHVRCTGKGRKERCTPLTTQVARTLRTWLDERGGGPDSPLFPASRGQPLSRDAVQLLVARHAKTAQVTCPTLRGKTISPHVLRHTAAMALLRAGTDITVIALWLGHEHAETAQIYIHADQTLKQQALDRTTPPGIRPGRYRPPDKLLAFLEQLSSQAPGLCRGFRPGHPITLAI
jgi:integrase/recombinase XerD